MWRTSSAPDAWRPRVLSRKFHRSGTWRLKPHDAKEWVLSVHEESHHRFVREACAAGRCILDGGDTQAGPGSYEAALASVDAALSAADAVVGGEVDNAFAPRGRRATTPCPFSRWVSASSPLRPSWFGICRKNTASGKSPWWIGTCITETAHSISSGTTGKFFSSHCISIPTIRARGSRARRRRGRRR